MEILINAIKDIHENIDNLPKAFGDKSFSLIVDKSHTEEASRTLKDPMDLPLRNTKKIVI